MQLQEILDEAIKLHEEGLLEKADFLYEQILTQETENPDIWNLAGVASWQIGNYHQSLERMEEAIRLDDNQAHYHNNIGNAYQSMEKYEPAIESYLYAIQLKDDFAQAWTNLGAAYHELGRNIEARKAHEKAITIDNSHSGALYNLGKLLLHLNDYAASEFYLHKAHEIDPHDIDILVTLGRLYVTTQNFKVGRSMFAEALSLTEMNPGIIAEMASSYYEEGDIESALARLRTAVNLAPDNTDLLTQYGLMLNEMQLVQEAAKCFHTVLNQDSNNYTAWKGLGDTLKISGNHEDALRALNRAISLKPDYDQAWLQTANILYEKARNENDELGSKTFQLAQTAYEHTLKCNPKDGLAKLMLTILKNENLDAIPDSYVEDLFNCYAPRFENHLQKTLQYNTPKDLFRILQEGTSCQFQKALDLGCGTGLMGDKIRTYVQELHGVDLSVRMLQKAKRKGVYDSLHRGNLLSHVSNNHGFDLITASDVLIYFGKLEKVFQAVHAALTDGGLFLFSVEKEPVEDLKLQLNGRYTHGKKYVEGIAARAGFTLILSKELQLRTENKVWVNGLGYLYRKG